MKTNSLARLLATLCVSLGIGGAAAADCDNPPSLRFSMVPQGNSRRDLAAFQPLLDALGRETGKSVEVIYPSSYGYVVEGILASSIDIAFMGPASYASAKNSDREVQAFASYSTRAGVFQEEGAYYRSLLVVRNTSRFHDARSLKGATLALVDPVSTSGAVVPRFLYSPLLAVPFENYFARVVYTGSHDKSVTAVARGQVDAAFVASNHLSDMISAGKAGKDDYRVIWRSEPIPLDPFVYRGRLCAPLKEQIRKVFLANNGEGYPAVLARLNAVRFSPISDDNYKVIREILSTLPR